MKVYLPLLVILVCGCSGAEVLQTTTSAAAIRSAEEVGAAQVPRAALHVQMAKEATIKAQRLAKSGRNKEARSLLLRAEADAELALLLAREQAEIDQTAAANEKVRQLQDSNR